MFLNPNNFCQLELFKFIRCKKPPETILKIVPTFHCLNKNVANCGPSASNFKSFSQLLEHFFFSQQVIIILVTKYQSCHSYDNNRNGKFKQENYWKSLLIYVSALKCNCPPFLTSVSKKTWTNYSTESLLWFVQIFMKQTLIKFIYRKTRA